MPRLAPCQLRMCSVPADIDCVGIFERRTLVVARLAKALYRLHLRARARAGLCMRPSVPGRRVRFVVGALRQAAEVRHLVPHVKRLVEKHRERLDQGGHRGTQLCNVFSLLKRFYAALHDLPRHPSERDARKFVKTAIALVHATQSAGIRQYPKTHLTIHGASQMAVLGSPQHYATFEDESYNKEVRRIFMSTHTANAGPRIPSKSRLLEDA